MVLISNGCRFVTLFALIWISSGFYHSLLSLDEPLIFFDEQCKIRENLSCNSVGNIGSKQSSECSIWLKKTASTLGRDIPQSITSVVIVAYNERKRILNETIESLLANTPHALLKEIIVVDDCSQPAIDLSSYSFKIQVNFDLASL